MSHSRKKIRALGDYLEAVQLIDSEWETSRSTIQPWFRGQGNSAWDLVPGLYRGQISSQLERELLRDFKLRSVPMLNSLQRPLNDLEWLFIMQHYGIPTRLLDWSENHLCALYFAVRDFKERADGCVWVVHPWALNKNAIGVVSVPTSDDARLNSYYLRSDAGPIERTVQAAIPVAIRPSHSTPRIQAQQGVFTLHGRGKEGLNKQYQKLGSLGLVKITIDGKRKRSILLELHRGGISEERFFPGLQGLCADITFRYSRSYMRTAGPPRKPDRRTESPTKRKPNDWYSSRPARRSFDIGSTK